MSRCVPLEPRKPSHRALQLSTKTPDRVVSSVACRNRRPAQGKRHFFRFQFHSLDGLGLWSLVKEYKEFERRYFQRQRVARAMKPHVYAFSMRIPKKSTQSADRNSLRLDNTRSVVRPTTTSSGFKTSRKQSTSRVFKHTS